MSRALSTGCLLLALAACGSSQPTPGTVGETTDRAFDALYAIDHRWFPLRPGSTWSYAGSENGHLVQEEVAVLEQLQFVDGVRCVVLVQDRLVDGEATETTRHWFSGDRDGNLWLFGEQSLEPGTPSVLGPDSWLAGRDGAEAMLWLPADPVPGEAVMLDLPHGQETLLFLTTTAEARGPAATFTGCLAVAETSGEEVDLILYAPGVGRVQETSPGSSLRLVERR